VRPGERKCRYCKAAKKKEKKKMKECLTRDCSRPVEGRREYCPECRKARQELSTLASQALGQLRLGRSEKLEALLTDPVRGKRLLEVRPDLYESLQKALEEAPTTPAPAPKAEETVIPSAAPGVEVERREEGGVVHITINISLRPGSRVVLNVSA
jgi:hypothetical protein